MSKQGQPVAKTDGQADQPPVDQLLTDIRSVIARARQQASTAVNAAQTYMYWHIGQRIHTELLGSGGLGDPVARAKLTPMYRLTKQGRLAAQMSLRIAP